MKRSNCVRWNRSALFASIFFLIAGCGANRALVRPVAMARRADIGPAITGRAALVAALDAALQDSALTSATAGVKIIRLRDHAVLYARNSKKLFHPASNMKLFTAAAALKYLGPGYRFSTTLATDSATVVRDTLNGPLYLVGSGDPSFDSGDLVQVIEKLKARGIRFLAGDIVCDDSRFDDVRYGSGWMWDDQPSTDFSPIGALAINGNNIEVFSLPGDSVGSPAKVRLLPPTQYVQVLNESTTIDSAEYYRQLQDSTITAAGFAVNRRWRDQTNVIEVTGAILLGSTERVRTMNIVDPTFYFGTLFREFCERAGIGVAGRIRRAVAPANAQTLVEHFSEPLALLIARMNKPSDNLYAEQFLKAVGAQVKGVPGTSKKGIGALQEMLREMGANVESVHFADGSGVSRYGLMSPDVIVTLLAAMHGDFRVRNEFIASLPIAGVDGTLDSRMQNTAAYRLVHAKTGTLAGVTTLAGYAPAQDGDELAFSIMMSHFVGSAKPLRDLQDHICDLLCRFRKTAK